MSVVLTARDYRALTGLQGRGFNKGSTSHTSGVLASYRGGLNINKVELSPADIEIGTGGLFVDGAFVEVTETETIMTTKDGTFKLVCEVNLANDSAIFKLVESITRTDNLTASNSGIHQFKLADVVRTSGTVESISYYPQYVYENIWELIISEFYNKETADKRYERAVVLNANYANEDFAGMTFAQVFNKLIYDNLTSTIASTITGYTTATSTFTNVHTALVDLISDIYGISTSSTLSFKAEFPFGQGLGGGVLMSVVENNGVSYEFQFDNYGTNYATVNTDAFKAADINMGNLFVHDLLAAYNGLSLHNSMINLYSPTDGYDYTVHDISGSVGEAFYNGMRWSYKNGNTAGRLQWGVTNDGERIVYLSGDFSTSAEVATGIRSKQSEKLYDYGASEYKAGTTDLLLAEINSLEQTLITEQNLQEFKLQMAEALSLPITRDTSRVDELTAMIKSKQAELLESQYVDEITQAESNVLSTKEYIDCYPKANYTTLIGEKNQLLLKEAEAKVEKIKQRYGKE